MAKVDQIQDPELRELVQRAHQAMRSGKPTDAVKTCAQAYLCMMERKPEMLDESIEPRPGRRMPRVMQWPQLGANLPLESVTAKEPKIEFARERFSLSEAITYFEYTVDTAVRQGF